MLLVSLIKNTALVRQTYDLNRFLPKSRVFFVEWKFAAREHSPILPFSLATLERLASLRSTVKAFNMTCSNLMYILLD